MKTVSDIDQYIAGFPEETQALLQQMRAAIRKIVPEAGEKIGYGIPTFTLNGNLVHFAGYKHHIGFYPGASGIKAFEKELSVYKNSKGAVQFPLDRPLPISLINKIVKFRVKESLAKNAARHTAAPGDLFASLSAPARRALESKGITTIQQLSKFSEAAILALHGMGKSSLPKLRNALKEKGLSFKAE
ncbi:Uncharacterized conserved protein YdhG, YjbR/CyaY-like superfamily, DUF1801 family [Chitinophaga ginsengisegetis]|uniref:Uncharacterized conserved protein YdhG, YjbR/CyaY-like superfamily, DUF1801 family n=1 Tax=Chitinophaga ginsengisegetis TaxID=393003 RepID=A0A1T5NK35_9BACT|nr:DUF1801 domain-containing protein [Chitinophaga ginsengisegetis]SKD00990.1 Uncharacterized conserved protein YdhG, YjbR/CyaY-like superfamily, DUF1801 family [Chitinophaga ginsengisegetis]